MVIPALITDLAPITALSSTITPASFVLGGYGSLVRVAEGPINTLFPIVIGNFGNNPNIVPLPFPFFPEISKFGNHSIVKNMGSIITKFVSSIDTVNNNNLIKKTPLLFTSDFSYVDNFPVVINLNDLGKNLDQSDFYDKSKLIGILLEGKFSSYFNNRLFDFNIKIFSGIKFIVQKLK